MLATQLMDTNNACDTDDQITQRVDSMNLDNLLTLSKNDKKLEPPKITQDTSIPKQVTAPCKDFKGTICGRINLIRLRNYRTGTPNSEDDMTPIMGNTKQHTMNTDATSNATIEGTK
ncbi:408_t:CDS:2, partial [Gigaspora margarita]